MTLQVRGDLSYSGISPSFAKWSDFPFGLNLLTAPRTYECQLQPPPCQSRGSSGADVKIVPPLTFIRSCSGPHKAVGQLFFLFLNPLPGLTGELVSPFIM